MLMIRISDYELVKMLLDDDSNVQIVNNNGYGRLDQDVKEALSELLNKYVNQEEELEYNQEQYEYLTKVVMKEMLKHINKLEKMLDKRNVNFKAWEEVEQDQELDYVI